MHLTDRCRFLNCSSRMGGRVWRDLLSIHNLILGGGREGERYVMNSSIPGFLDR
jgi:hypothetical protein